MSTRPTDAQQIAKIACDTITAEYEAGIESDKEINPGLGEPVYNAHAKAFDLTFSCGMSEVIAFNEDDEDEDADAPLSRD